MKMGVNNQVQSAFAGRIQFKVDKDESSQYGACSTICCTAMQGAWYFFALHIKFRATCVNKIKTLGPSAQAVLQVLERC